MEELLFYDVQLFFKSKLEYVEMKNKRINKEINKEILDFEVFVVNFIKTIILIMDNDNYENLSKSKVYIIL